MSLRRPSLAFLACLASVSFLGCATESADSGEQTESSDHEFSSREAVLLDFELDGELVSDSSWNPRQKIQDQFLYTIGHLNADRSVGRLDRLTLTNIQSSPLPEGGYRVTYHAKMPVAWGKKSSMPGSYSFTLPRAIGYAGLQEFTTKYSHGCVERGAHDVTSGSMWYYYRPRQSACRLADEDVLTFAATVTPSVENTTGKYPEYQRVWQDDELRVVAIFGKNEEGATSNDAGISAYNAFVESMRSTLRPLSLTTEPAVLPSSPGVAAPDATFSATLADGKKVTVNVLLIDKVSAAPESFYRRYESLSSSADVIMYNGHAGLGQNVRALANRGRFVPGKYLMLFMNGCDTFAYVDGSLAEKRAPLNPDDQSGTKYMDIVTNAMPSYFHSNSRASTALVKGLMATAQPQTYEQMFAALDTQQVVLVTGEEDNTFTPGMPIGSGGGGGEPWAGLDESGSVARAEEKRYATPSLPAGSYTFVLAGTGDADLYVKRGSEPTTQSFDCRPYKYGSAETCTVTLDEPSVINVMVRGYSSQSTFTLEAQP